MRLVWSDRALDDLERIGGYVAEANPGAANRLISRIWAHTTPLKKHPRLGRMVPEMNDETLREVFEGNYRIVYRHDEDRIAILTVFEGHRLFQLENGHS